MSDVSVTMTLAMIEHGLREDVLANVTDSHAAAALRAAMTMVKNVRAELEAGHQWRADLVAMALPLASSWADALPPDAASEVAARVYEARGAHVVRAHELVMQATAIALEAVWQQKVPNRDLLAQLRRVTRQDAEARAAIAR